MALISEAQLAANRRNALLSKGAISQEGKAVVCNNALRHGLTSDRIVLPDEDPDAFIAMREGLIRDHSPSNNQESDLVDQIATNYWRLLRAQRVETGLFESAMHPQAPRRTSRESMEIHEPFARAFCRHSQQFDNLRRYTASIERAYYRSLEALRKIQKDRKSSELGTVPQRPSTARTRPSTLIPPQALASEGLASVTPCEINQIGSVSRSGPLDAPPASNFPEISAA